MADFLNDLNDMQKEAVKTTEGPLLILAGAGSGKTKALVYRIAYLISEKNVEPERILAVTFTNKAAKEMIGRVERLLTRNNRTTKEQDNSCLSSSGLTRGSIEKEMDSRRSLSAGEIPASAGMTEGAISYPLLSPYPGSGVRICRKRCICRYRILQYLCRSNWSFFYQM